MEASYVRAIDWLARNVDVEEGEEFESTYLQQHIAVLAVAKTVDMNPLYVAEDVETYARIHKLHKQFQPKPAKT